MAGSGVRCDGAAGAKVRAETGEDASALVTLEDRAQLAISPSAATAAT